MSGRPGGNAGAPPGRRSDREKSNVITSVNGQKGSGKSWWVKHSLIPLWDRVLVLDPMAEYSPHVDAVLSSPAALKDYLLRRGAHHHLAPFRVAMVPTTPADSLTALRLAWALPGTLLVLEEVDQIAHPGYSPPELAQLILRGRHRRISVATITQRPAATPIQLRSQADLIAVFRLTMPRDAEAVAHWVQSTPQELYNLPTGTARFAVTSDAPARWGIHVPLDSR